MAYFKRRFFPKREYPIPFKWIFLIIIIGFLYLFLKFVLIFKKGEQKTNMLFPKIIRKEVT